MIMKLLFPFGVGSRVEATSKHRRKTENEFFLPNETVYSFTFDFSFVRKKGRNHPLVVLFSDHFRIFIRSVVALLPGKKQTWSIVTVLLMELCSVRDRCFLSVDTTFSLASSLRWSLWIDTRWKHHLVRSG